MGTGPSARRRPSFVIALVALGLVAAACGSGGSAGDADVSAEASVPASSTSSQQPPTSAEDTDSPTTSADEAAAADTVAPTTGPEVDVSNYPQFTSITSDGEAFDSLDYAGQDVLLWFWAPW